MQNFLNRTKRSPTLPGPPSPPTNLDILRYRSHHGANLGSIFVLEKWLFPAMFEPGASGGSELDAVTASIAAIGLEKTRMRWEKHWAEALSAEDIIFLKDTAHITSIRLPIGYFTLGPAFCAKTPFEPVTQVYKNAWKAVLQLCERLSAAGIGVLLDLHAVPGGANEQDHGGTSCGKAEMWGNKRALEAARKCVMFIAEEVARGEVKGCIGIELCNEACWGAKGMYAWYEDVARSVNKIDGSIPLYISDAWDLSTALKWTANQNKVDANKVEKGGNPIFVDTHKYYTFTDHDRSQSPQQIIERVSNELAEMGPFSGDVGAKSAVAVVVGEWSCVMDGATWAKSQGSDKDTLVRQFGTTQAEKWRSAAAGGYFWTAKMQWMDGGEWGLFEMVKKGALVAPANLALSSDGVKDKVKKAKETREAERTENVQAHVGYWDGTNPGGKFEHWRFEHGWDLGFSDALGFFEFAGSTVGALDLWVVKRMRDCGRQGPFLWEWEHGVRQGVKAFEAMVL